MISKVSRVKALWYIYEGFSQGSWYVSLGIWQVIILPTLGLQGQLTKFYDRFVWGFAYKFWWPRLLIKLTMTLCWAYVNCRGEIKIDGTLRKYKIRVNLNIYWMLNAWMFGNSNVRGLPDPQGEIYNSLSLSTVSKVSWHKKKIW